MTKKLLLGLAALATLTACNSDKDDFTANLSFQSLNLVTPQPYQSNSSVCETNYTFYINYTQMMGSLNANSIMVDNTSYSFASPTQKLSAVSKEGQYDYYKLAYDGFPLNNGAGSVAYFEGLFTSLSLFVPPAAVGSPQFMYPNRIAAQYILNAGQKAYYVQTFPIDCVYVGNTTATINGGNQNTNAEISYRVQINPKTMKADMYIYNAKFSSSENEPTKNFILKGLTVEPGNKSYKISGENVVPVAMFEGTPYNNYKFSNITLRTVDNTLSTVMIEFKIPMTGDVTYRATFQGSNRVMPNMYD